MKKKVEKFAASIITSNLDTAKHLHGTISYNGRYYVTDSYRALEVEYPIPEFPVITNEHMGKKLEDIFNKAEEGNKTMHPIPSASEIKKGIADLVGRKMDDVVLRIAGDSHPSVYPAVNARFLRDAVQALNCKVCYFDESERITCRPADLLEPELAKLEEELGEYKEQDEDVLTYALFGQVAMEYFRRRAALRNKVDPDAMDMKNKAYPA